LLSAIPSDYDYYDGNTGDAINRNSSVAKKLSPDSSTIQSGSFISSSISSKSSSVSKKIGSPPRKQKSEKHQPPMKDASAKNAASSAKY
jgi:hypothetical protein